MEEAITRLLQQLGYSLEDPNIRETPQRVARMYDKYRKPTKEEIAQFFEKKFPTNYKGMVIKKGIHVTSLCPHHLMPIDYKISIGIIYNEDALGISKFTRFVKRLASQLILQETLTSDIKDILLDHLAPRGVAVVVEGIHGCEKFRGIEQEVPTITCELVGPFEEDPKCREEFFFHIRNNTIH